MPGDLSYYLTLFLSLPAQARFARSCKSYDKIIQAARDRMLQNAYQKLNRASGLNYIQAVKSYREKEYKILSHIKPLRDLSAQELILFALTTDKITQLLPDQLEIAIDALSKKNLLTPDIATNLRLVNELIRVYLNYEHKCINIIEKLLTAAKNIPAAQNTLKEASDNMTSAYYDISTNAFMTYCIMYHLNPATNNQEAYTNFLQAVEQYKIDLNKALHNLLQNKTNAPLNLSGFYFRHDQSLFLKMDLSYTVLTNCYINTKLISDVNFTHALLTHTQIFVNYLKNINFYRADLRHASIKCTDIGMPSQDSKVNFAEANLSNIAFHLDNYSVCSSLENCQLDFPANSDPKTLVDTVYQHTAQMDIRNDYTKMLFYKAVAKHLFAAAQSQDSVKEVLQLLRNAGLPAIQWGAANHVFHYYNSFVQQRALPQLE
jgi:uncharacterized protein YjbI with pentapeptide repeats